MHAEPGADTHRAAAKTASTSPRLNSRSPNIGAGIVVQERRALLHRLLRIDGDWQRLVVDDDEFERVLG